MTEYETHFRNLMIAKRIIVCIQSHGFRAVLKENKVRESTSKYIEVTKTKRDKSKIIIRVSDHPYYRFKENEAHYNVIVPNGVEFYLTDYMTPILLGIKAKRWKKCRNTMNANGIQSRANG